MSERGEMGVMGYKGGREQGWERVDRHDPGGSDAVGGEEEDFRKGKY